MSERLMPEAAGFVSHCCAWCWDRDRKQLPADTFVPLGMIVCPVCGNKRCPKATFHDMRCTGSNEPGQPGSRY